MKREKQMSEEFNNGLRMRDYTGCNPDVVGNEKDAEIASLITLLGKALPFIDERSSLVVEIQAAITLKAEDTE